jgi:hypothetical protein
MKTDTAKELPIVVVEDPPAPALQAIYFDGMFLYTLKH